MTRIEQIYETVFSRLPECVKSDEDLTEKIEEAARDMAQTENEYNRLTHTMHIGASYGQQSGFVSGFRFAVALLAESLVG